MKKPLIALGLILVMVGVGYFGYTRWQRGQGDETLTLYGNVDIREVQLSFRVDGRLQTMNFEEGDTVPAGALLAVLDDQPLGHRLAVAEAQAEAAEARLELLRQGSRPQEIRRARSSVEEARAGLKHAQLEFSRQRELVDKELGSQNLLDQARAGRDQWSARLDAAVEALKLADEGFRKEEISAAEATLAAARAQLEQARLQFEDTRLFAPAAGQIMTRVVEPGTMLKQGNPVYSLSLLETIYVRAYVDEPRLGHVVPGTRVRVFTDSGGKSYRGQVGFVSPRAEFTPKNVETPSLRTDLVYRLRILVTDADQHLRQGMPVTVQFPGA